MKIKPTTITIEEEPGSGNINIRAVVLHQNGESRTATTIREHTIGRKVEAIADKILEILKDWKNDGTLEAPYGEFIPLAPDTELNMAIMALAQIAKKSHITDEMRETATMYLDQKTAIDRSKRMGMLEEKLSKSVPIKVVEEMLWLPCCHTTGMHDPAHFRERKYVCEYQMREALKRMCEAIGINPVTQSDPECGWCKDYPENKKGEGLPLLQQ